jgi:hypothetical protein
LKKLRGGMFMFKRLFTICLSVIILVGLSSFSYAQSAWVLWTKTKNTHFSKERNEAQESIGWELNSAWDKKSQCDEWVITNWGRMVTLEREKWSFADVDGRIPGVITITFKDKKDYPISIVESFVCLPDTIDPREKWQKRN